MNAAISLDDIPVGMITGTPLINVPYKLCIIFLSEEMKLSC